MGRLDQGSPDLQWAAAIAAFAEILKQSDSKTIGQAAQRNGMRVLREDGARQVLAGVTSVEEVLAATQANEMEAAE